MNDLYEQYLRHQKGLILLWVWLDQWRSIEGWHMDGAEIKLSHLTSQRFAIGAPKKKSVAKSRLVFLGVQPQEQAWLKRITWSRAVYDKDTSYLWLVSSSRESPDEIWPDLPPIAVGLRVNTETLSDWKEAKIEWRGIWWDDDNISHVGLTVGGQMSVQRGSLAQKWSETERASVKNLREVVLERLQKTSVYADPGFEGTPGNLSSEQQKLLDPVKVDKSQAIEESYPDLFGQFLDPSLKKTSK